MSSFTWPPSGGGGVPTYATFADFPPASSNTGSLAIALDTGFIYESFGGSWVLVASPGDILSLGPFGSTPNADGASASGNVLTLQPADGTNPGGVSITAQTLAGAKTFSTAPILSSLTASTGLQLDASKNITSATLGTATETTSSVLTLSGWTNATFGSPTILVKQSSGSQNGYLSSVDWTTFNGKQAAGSYITSLTGDVTASGPGAAGATAAATQSNITSIPNLATVGTIGSGTWQGTAVGAQYGGTGIDTHSSTGVPSISSGTWSTSATLPISLGGTGQASAGAAFNALAPATAKGGVIGGTGSNTYGNLAVGTNGFALVADSTQTTGLNWASTITNPMTTIGDIIYGGASGAPQRLAGNTTTTPEFYTSTGTGSAAQALTLTGSTGSGNVVLATSPTLVTPVLGTPSSGTLTSCTLFSGLNQFGAMYASSTTAAASTAAGTVGYPLVANSSAAPTFQQLSLAAGVTGTLPATNGGTAQSTYATGDTIYASATNTLSKLGIGGTGTVLAVVAGAPAWATVNGNTAILKAPTATVFFSNPGTTAWLFTITTSTTCAVGDTYTNNGHTYTVLGALAAKTGQVLWMSQSQAPTASGNLIQTSGAGTATIAYTSALAGSIYTAPTSPAPIALYVTLVGGGAGGAGTGTSPGAAAAGGDTNFGILSGGAVAVAQGGQPAAGITGGAGGTSTPGGFIGLNSPNGGMGGATASNATALPGGMGGASRFGGAGAGGQGATNGGNAASNSGGGGGGGGGNTSVNAGGGGGAGATLRIIVSGGLLPATIPFTFGASGGGGTAGGGGVSGGNGGSGSVEIIEVYQ